MYLIFDTETTGLPRNFNAPITDTDNWPRCVQIAWQLHDDMGRLIEDKNYLIQPEGYSIPYSSEQIHGISTELAIAEGVDLNTMLKEFAVVSSKAKFIVGQNLKFDVNIMGSEFYRKSIENPIENIPVLDTCTKKTAALCQITGGKGGGFKLPTLTELHEHLFGEPFNEAHNASADVEATTRCFLELIRREVYTTEELKIEESYFNDYQEINPILIPVIGLKHVNLKKASTKYKTSESNGETVDGAKNLQDLENVAFSHFHNHSQFSILQSTTQINALIQRAVDFGMPAVALTDNGNMLAGYHFIEAGNKHNKSINTQLKELAVKIATPGGDLNEISDWEHQAEELKSKLIKPILGVEFYVCRDRNNKKVKDDGFQIPMLAKNKAGYHNLAKMASEANVFGFYYVPRIDKQYVLDHKQDVIVLTGGLQGEIPSLIINDGVEKAEEAFKWWKNEFGSDFYVELLRHGLAENKIVNDVLRGFAEKYDVKIIATNNTFYLDKSDAEAHDILLCVKAGERKSTPIGRGRGKRFGFPNDEFYFKTQDEMKELFKDIPEAIINTNEIVDKIEIYTLAREVLLPEYDIPEEFRDPKDLENPKLKNGENNFLRHLTYEGAKKRYGEITPEITERLDFELDTIRNTGYPGYFLIVQDFCKKAKEMDVSVGPGRGSAAGSVVAYCNEITNIDPLKYDLLFERFLNPERVSMPDIDIDFDDEGRGRVMQYVIDKYGASQVAQIVTYGTMAAKSSIRDTGRVLDLPLMDTDRIAKLVPNIKLNKLFTLSDEELEKKLNRDDLALGKQLIEIYHDNSPEGDVVRMAKSLEGSVRNLGTHACGVIITPDDIRNYVPVSRVKDSEMWCTQFDNSVAEDAGLLKMDFLGLKTLTLIKDTLKIVKARHNIDIDIEEIDIEDKETYELFQRGETVGIFQYESPGMQKHLKALVPTVFGDLIAMNALYRPGPMEYIPDFIDIKHGRKELKYDLADCEEYLAETYGITVYQEQVMLLSQKLAGFTKGEADTLRKAMGKKQIAMLEKMKPKFLQQGGEKGHDKKILEKIWKDWEAFAAYAFNKSHSTCYAWIAYQTAFLKAHYPAEYMAAVLSNNMNDIKSVTFFMEECRRMGLTVLGPDINESYYKFAVNKEGAIRFGMGAIKGVGEGAVASIVEERKKGGIYRKVTDFLKRIDGKSANKKTLEGLVFGGGLDSFGINRSKYLAADHRGITYLEHLIKFGSALRAQADAPPDLFGGIVTIEIQEPVIPECEDWSALEQLSKEKEVVGIYISGHPLDDFKIEIDNFCNMSISKLNELNSPVNGEIAIAGMVMDSQHRFTKKGDPFGVLHIEDYSDAKSIYLFSEDYVKFKDYLNPGWFLFVKGRFQAKRWNKDEFEFKITQIELLNNIRTKLTKSITLNLDLPAVNDTLIHEIDSIVKVHSGNCKLSIQVKDEDERLLVVLPSKRLKIEPSNEFFSDLTQAGITYKLN